MYISPRLALASFVGLVASLTSLVDAKSAAGQRVLVVVEHEVNRLEYSRFWDSLKSESGLGHGLRL